MNVHNQATLKNEKNINLTATASEAATNNSNNNNNKQQQTTTPKSK
jgi:hypothetical protein